VDTHIEVVILSKKIIQVIFFLGAVEPLQG